MPAAAFKSGAAVAVCDVQELVVTAWIRDRLVDRLLNGAVDYEALVVERMIVNLQTNLFELEPRVEEVKAQCKSGFVLHARG